MTAWDNHHPPHDHPDFGAYLDTLTDDDIEAINATMPKTDNHTHDTDNNNDIPEN